MIKFRSHDTDIYINPATVWGINSIQKTDDKTPAHCWSEPCACFTVMTAFKPVGGGG